MLNAVCLAAQFQDLVRGRRRGFGPALARLGLTAASVPYGTAVRLRNRLFDAGWKARHRAAVPVVSVGNLTLGGTGKTPCVEYLARFYRDRGFRVAILSRGYGGGDAAGTGPNDEALVLEENLPDVPHLQGADRVALAGVAVEELEADLLILDDGFQHRRLARDLDVVLLDATDPFGQGRLFPRGLLREPASSLRRADAVLVSRCDQVAESSVRELTNRARSRAAVGQLCPRRMSRLLGCNTTMRTGQSMHCGVGRWRRFVASAIRRRFRKPCAISASKLSRPGPTPTTILTPGRMWTTYGRGHDNSRPTPRW